MEQVESRLRTLKHEELFVFDKDGNIIAAYKGDRDSVIFPSELLKEKGVTVTHGHPKGASNFGGTFSLADMKNMLNSQWAEHRVTASGQGEMNYILRRTSRSDAKGFYDQINRDFKNLNKMVDNMWDNMFKTAKNAGKPLAQAIHEARQASVGLMNRYYRDTARKFGFEYVTRKKPYKYNR